MNGVIRGSSRNHSSDSERVVRRQSQTHNYASTNVGFRLCEWCIA